MQYVYLYMSASLLYASPLLFINHKIHVLATNIAFIETQRHKHLQRLGVCHSSKNDDISDNSIESIPFTYFPTQPNSRRMWFSDTATSVGAIFGLSTLVSKPQTALASSISSSLCDPSVSVLKNYSNNRLVYILGSAHISSNSADVAGQLVREIKPEAVFVELDAKRVARALPPSKKPSSNIPEDNSSSSSSAVAVNSPLASSTATSSSSSLTVKSPPSSTTTSNKLGGIFNIRERVVEASSQIVGDAIRGLYKKLETEGFSAGEEFVVAVKAGQALGSTIILGDRDVDVTIRRLTEALAKTDIKKLFSDSSELEQSMKKFLPQDLRDAPMDMSLSKEQLSEYVETMKAKENVKVIMANLKAIAPELYNAMVAERDDFMSMGLNSLNQFRTTVAVMGVAHVDGVENNLIRQGWTKIEISCPLSR